MSVIRGWLTESEGNALAYLAEGKVVLEIGSYCGKSTVAMARKAKRIYALDWHKGDAGAGFGDTLNEFWTNLRQNGCDNVVPLVGKTEDLFVLGSMWADMVFVDGAHDYVAVKRDLLLAKQCMKQKALLLMHDWNQEDVRKAYQDVCGFNKTEQVVDTLMLRQGGCMEFSQEFTLTLIGKMTLQLEALGQEIALLKAEAQDRKSQLSVAQHQLTEKMKLLAELETKN